jgi:hypothetical protein
MKKILYEIQKDMFGNFAIVKKSSGKAIFVLPTKEEAERTLKNSKLFQ